MKRILFLCFSFVLIFCISFDSSVYAANIVNSSSSWSVFRFGGSGSSVAPDATGYKGPTATLTEGSSYIINPNPAFRLDLATPQTVSQWDLTSIAMPAALTFTVNLYDSSMNKIAGSLPRVGTGTYSNVSKIVLFVSGNTSGYGSFVWHQPTFSNNVAPLAVIASGGVNSVTGTISGGVPPYRLVVGGMTQTISATSFSFSGVPAGNYTLTVSDAMSASATANVIVTVPALSMTAIPSSGRVSGVVAGGQPPYQVVAGSQHSSVTTSGGSYTFVFPAGSAGQSVTATDSLGTVVSQIVDVPAVPPIPLAPISLITSSMTSHSFVLSWQPSAGATSYSVKLDGSVYQTNVTQSYLLISGLSPGQSVLMSVAAVNANGTSTYSPLSVTTPSGFIGDVTSGFAGIGMSLTDFFAAVGNVFSSFWVIFVLTIGAHLTFYVIRRARKIFHFTKDGTVNLHTGEFRSYGSYLPFQSKNKNKIRYISEHESKHYSLNQMESLGLRVKNKYSLRERFSEAKKNRQSKPSLKKNSRHSSKNYRHKNGHFDIRSTFDDRRKENQMLKKYFSRKRGGGWTLKKGYVKRGHIIRKQNVWDRLFAGGGKKRR